MRARKMGEAGFTLIELLLAVFIFSAVMGGLAVVFATAITQGVAMMGEANMKGQALVAMKSIQGDVTTATRLDVPASGASGRHLQGMQNMSPATIGGQAMTPVQMDGGTPVTWFHYCISDNTNSPCGDPAHAVECLWRYQGNLPVPTINDGNCGSSVGGVTPVMITSWIEPDAPICGASPCIRFFSRSSTEDVFASNQVRINFRIKRPASGNRPMARFTVDTAYNGQFAP